MKYFRRFRPLGEEFFVDESGNIVDKATAKTNLVESSRGQADFVERINLAGQYLQVSAGAAGSRRQSAAAARADYEARREKMDEAFARFLPANS